MCSDTSPTTAATTLSGMLDTLRSRRGQLNRATGSARDRRRRELHCSRRTREGPKQFAARHRPPHCQVSRRAEEGWAKTGAPRIGAHAAMVHRARPRAHPSRGTLDAPSRRVRIGWLASAHLLVSLAYAQPGIELAPPAAL